MQDNYQNQNQYQPVYPDNSGQNYAQSTGQLNNDPNAYGPRQLSLFTLFAKTFLGLCGGMFGSLILLLIFLASSSILQPVLSPADAGADQVNPIFIVILMAMIFVTSLISSMLSPLLLSYTERLRYPKIITALYQIFIMNLVVFFFTAPIYLTTSTTSLEFTAYAAGLQIVLVAMASSLFMEIINDQRYPLLGVYTSLLGILVATATNVFIFQILKSTTVLLFAALPITWASIGFFQATLAMIYYWYYINWGNDFLAASTSYGSEYAGVAEEEAEIEAEEKLPEDKDGGDFLKS
ncbi:hypothetical protein IT412_01025 [Candidatus Peregrinibacteria bacterium]|nr:hypothetical protein [Candidatus Peregrinibacteria bacterium]